MKIDGNILSSIQGQAINLSDLKGILEKLNIGDIVKAQILEITSSDVLLKLFDGSTVKASTKSNIEGKQGDILNLVVKDKIDNQLVFETVKNNDPKPGANDNEIKIRLAEMGLKVDSKNIDIVKELKSNSLPINKETLNKLVDLVTRFKDLTPSKAAFLLSGNMEPEEKNIAALNQLVDGKAKISVKLNDIIKMVNNITDTEVLKNIEKQLLDIKPSVPITSVQRTSNSEMKLPEIKNVNIPEIKIQQTNESTIKETVTNIVNENIKNFENKNIKNTITSQQIINNLVETLKENSITTISSDKAFSDFDKSTNILNKLTINEQNILKNTFDNMFQKIKANLLLNKDELQNPKQNVNLNENIKIKENITKVFDKFIIDVKSDTLKEDLNIKNLYKDIFGKLEVIKENVTNSNLLSKNEITSSIDNLQNNMRFMNELSNHNTYIQIPLQIWDKNTTGELYILKKDNRKKKIDAENVTVFISLNTENLGQVDSLIGVNKKNISVNLRVEDQEIINYLKDNYKELYEKLQNKGYKLVDMKYRLIEEEANILNIKDIVNKEASVGKSSIDYRL